MTPLKIRARIIAERTSWIRRMLEDLRAFPCTSYQVFMSDPRTSAAAESYLRRALEALLDMGRHILAKGFGKAVVEYKEIPIKLREEGILNETETDLLREMAGYRNRMVHFYDEISSEELYQICADRVGDIDKILTSILKWVDSHSEMIDKS